MILNYLNILKLIIIFIYVSKLHLKKRVKKPIDFYVLLESE